MTSKSRLDDENAPESSSPGTNQSSTSKGKSAQNERIGSTSNPASFSSIPLPLNWPQSYPVGPGYHNLGNTCFLNSTLQALTHTAPLVACLMGDSQHNSNTCTSTANSMILLKAIPMQARSAQMASSAFCALCKSIFGHASVVEDVLLVP